MSFPTLSCSCFLVCVLPQFMRSRGEYRMCHAIIMCINVECYIQITTDSASTMRNVWPCTFPFGYWLTPHVFKLDFQQADWKERVETTSMDYDNVKYLFILYIVVLHARGYHAGRIGTHVIGSWFSNSQGIHFFVIKKWLLTHLFLCILLNPSNGLRQIPCPGERSPSLHYDYTDPSMPTCLPTTHKQPILLIFEAI